MIPMEQLIGIGAVSSAIRQKLCVTGATLWNRKRVGGTAPPKPLLGARRTSYRHCWSGHAEVTTAIELPESAADGCSNPALCFRIVLTIQWLSRPDSWTRGALWLGSFLEKPTWGKTLPPSTNPFPLPKRIGARSSGVADLVL